MITELRMGNGVACPEVGTPQQPRHLIASRMYHYQPYNLMNALLTWMSCNYSDIKYIISA